MGRNSASISAQIRAALEDGSAQAHERFRQIVFSDWQGERQAIRSEAVEALGAGWQPNMSRRRNLPGLCALFDRVQWFREVLAARPVSSQDLDFKWLQTPERWLNHLCGFKLDHDIRATEDLATSALSPVSSGSADLVALAIELGAVKQEALQKWSDLSPVCAAVIAEAQMGLRISTTMDLAAARPAPGARLRRAL